MATTSHEPPSRVEDFGTMARALTWKVQEPEPKGRAHTMACLDKTFGIVWTCMFWILPFRGQFQPPANLKEQPTDFRKTSTDVPCTGPWYPTYVLCFGSDVALALNIKYPFPEFTSSDRG